MPVTSVTYRMQPNSAGHYIGKGVKKHDGWLLGTKAVNKANIISIEMCLMSETLKIEDVEDMSAWFPNLQNLTLFVDWNTILAPSPTIKNMVDFFCRLKKLLPVATTTAFDLSFIADSSAQRDKNIVTAVTQAFKSSDGEIKFGKSAYITYDHQCSDNYEKKEEMVTKYLVDMIGDEAKGWEWELGYYDLRAEGGEDDDSEEEERFGPGYSLEDAASQKMAYFQGDLEL